MRKTTPAPSIDRVKEILDFDLESGDFRWKKRVGRAVVGELAGCVRKNGYRSLNIDGVRYLNHRLVWLMVHGVMPTYVIDHIDGDRLNNRPDNLRDIPQSLNCHNRSRKNPNNTTGFPGVTVLSGKFAAQIMIGRKHLHLGLFENAEEAYLAYRKAKVAIGITVP